jgi:5-methylcytosine-specific restriction protein B
MATLCTDSHLGQAFRIGHSTVTPPPPPAPGGPLHPRRFAEVVASELKPLLQEYWFDAPEQAAREAERLLEGW